MEATSDIVVHGTIRGGFVRSAGNIEVVEGIITSERGRVQARGNVKAQFIENSNIVCGGDLMVQTAIINSQIICGGAIKMLNRDGVVAGGHISCRDSLVTGNLGFRNGAVTHLNVGVDWKAEVAVRIKSGRIDKLKNRAAEDRSALRELVQKSAAQLTKKHKEMKEELQDRLQRLRKILEKLDEQLKKAEQLLTYNSDSKVYVREILASNVDLHVGGQTVAVANEVAGVAILSKRRRGSYIQPSKKSKQKSVVVVTWIRRDKSAISVRCSYSS